MFSQGGTCAKRILARKFVFELRIFLRKMLRKFPRKFLAFFYFARYRPKGVFEKGVGNSKNASEMHQKCVKKCVKMGLVLLGKEERSKMRRKLRQKYTEHLWGEHLPFGRYRFVGPKTSRKNSHQISSRISLPKSNKNSPTSFCRSAGRIFLGGHEQ